MSKSKKKKVLISGYIGFSNFGDDAMLSVLVKHLKENGHEVSALSSSPKNTKETFKINAYNYKNIFSILKGILSSNVLISGGGNLLQNETSTKSLLYYLFIIFLAKLCFKKVILFSQGIGPIRGSIQTLLTKIILKLPNIITVRDIYSQKILSKWGINSKYTYDAVWTIDTPPYSPKGIVGIQLRNYDLMFKEYAKHLAKYIDMFFSDREIRFYPFENNADSAACYEVQRELLKRNPQIKTSVVPYTSVEETVREFSNLEYLIAMRLHANILALKFGIKTLPISYSVKVRNLAYELDLKFGEASEEVPYHALLTDLTLYPQDNPKIRDARKRQFEWGYIDSVLNK